MTALVLFDDEVARGFMPFALTRPLCEVRAGALLIRQRWERALRATSTEIVTAPHLADFEEAGAPPVTHGTLPEGVVVASSRCVVSLGAGPGDVDVWMCEGRVAAVRIGRDLQVETLERERMSMEQLPARGSRVANVDGMWLEAVWDLVGTLGARLSADIDALSAELPRMDSSGLAVLGDHPVVLEQGASVEPYVVFDATAGPILVRAGASIRAFSRLVGPCVIHSGTTILGDRVSGCSIGEGCMIRGEISDSIVIGNANKAHDGFVGHSVLGRWVNLGAGTITSNLKNTYGTVSLMTPDGLRDTGQLKLGAFLGDHVKTGIGLRLTTGSVIGAGSNVYGASMPPKSVPPFSWGEGDALGEYALDKFLAMAERAMGRRGVALGDAARRQLTAAHGLAHPRR